MKPCYISITASKILHFAFPYYKALCIEVRSYTKEKRNDIFAREYMFPSLNEIC
jgi:hypothetical protein